MDPGRKPVKQADMGREQERTGAHKQPPRNHRQDPAGYPDSDQGPAGDLTNQGAFIQIQGITMILTSA